MNLIPLSPEEFLAIYKPPPGIVDHHFTGPFDNQQPEGHGSIYHTEGLILAALVYRLAARGPILEIGADQGVSTRYIHQALDLLYPDAPPDLDTSVFSIDCHHKWDEDPNWPRRIRLDQRSDAPLPATFSGCQFAFVDGDHRYAGVVNDIKVCRKHNIPNLLFHDTNLTLKRNPENASAGSDAREAVLDILTDAAAIYDITTPCGMMFVRLDQ